MTNKTMKTLQKLAGSWFRSFAAACIACIISGITDWRIVLNAGAAAVLPVIYRYLNPKDPFPRS